MEAYISLQCRNFLVAVALGGFMAMSYDILRVLKLLLPSLKKPVMKNIIFSIIDIIFFLVFSLITFITIFYINSGEIRFYIFCGIFLGAVIIHYTIGNFIYVKARKVIFKIKDFIKVIYNKIKVNIEKRNKNKEKISKKAEEKKNKKKKLKNYLKKDYEKSEE